MNAPLGNRNAIGGVRNARTFDQVSRLIVLLHDRRGLRFAEIRQRLSADFGLVVSLASVCNRYRRGKKNNVHDPSRLQ